VQLYLKKIDLSGVKNTGTTLPCSILASKDRIEAQKKCAITRSLIKKRQKQDLLNKINYKKIIIINNTEYLVNFHLERLTLDLET